MSDENVENILRVSSAGDRVPSATSSSGRSHVKSAPPPKYSAPQNSARDGDIIIPASGGGTNKIFQLTKPASNVFIDTGIRKQIMPTYIRLRG